MAGTILCYFLSPVNITKDSCSSTQKRARALGEGLQEGWGNAVDLLSESMNFASQLKAMHPTSDAKETEGPLMTSHREFSNLPIESIDSLIWTTD